MSLLEVTDLSVTFGRRRRVALDRVSFRLDAGQRLGIIGESGSGKTVTALAVLGLLPETAHVTGSVRLAGRELVGLDDAVHARLRGDLVSMVFQEPMTAPDPTMRVGRPVAAVLRLPSPDRAGAARPPGLEALGALHGEGHAVDGHDVAAAERDGEVIDLEVAHATSRSLGSSRSRSPSPSRLKPSVATAIARPGQSANSGALKR